MGNPWDRGKKETTSEVKQSPQEETIKAVTEEFDYTESSEVQEIKNKGIVKKVTPVKPPVIEVDDRYLEGNPWYMSTEVNSDYNPKDSLLTHISGARWGCTYYQQIRDVDQGLDSNSSSSGYFQQLRKIERFELRVDSYLTPEQNEHSEMSMVGTSTVYTSLIPNVGDTFVAAVNDGRVAEFTVTRVQRLTMAKNTCYSIDYSLVDYVTEQNGRQKALDDKVFQTFVFHSDYLRMGMNPFLSVEDTVDNVKLERRLHEMSDRYLSEFYNYYVNTLIYPTSEEVTEYNQDGGSKFIYDTYLTDFVKQVFEDRTGEIRQYITSGGNTSNLFDRDTVWDLLLERRNTRRPHMIIAATARHSSYKYGQPHLNQIQWSPIHFYMYGRLDFAGHCINESEEYVQMGILVDTVPDWGEGWYDVEYNNYGYDSGLALGQLVPYTRPKLRCFNIGITENSLVPPKPITPVPPPPIIYPVNQHNYYVLSSFWYYEERERYSLLEVLVDDYLNSRPVNKNKLMLVIEDMDKWSKIDRFYYTPIVYTLIKITLMNY